MSTRVGFTVVELLQWLHGAAMVMLMVTTVVSVGVVLFRGRTEWWRAAGWSAASLAALSLVDTVTGRLLPDCAAPAVEVDTLTTTSCQDAGALLLWLALIVLIAVAVLGAWGTARLIHYRSEGRGQSHAAGKVVK